ncbi:MAG: ABC transporter permease [Eubacteriales bacterium]|nr:ABC transporter permease [Eubacteriales bacterium]
MKGNKNIKKILIENNTYLIAIGLFIVCAVVSERFLTLMNIRNIALQQAGPMCCVLGMLFVILTGGIDLSVGSMMALGSSLSAYLIVNVGLHFIPAIIVSLAVGILCGSFTGILVAYGKFQGFVASLAMMTMARGASLVITNGSPIRLEKDTLATLVNGSYGYPILIFIVLIIALLCFVQHYTSYGRIVIAIGSNSQAVEMAGIRTKKYIVSVYALSSMLAVLGGIFIAARASTGSGTIGEGQELDAIASCVIGGASLAGGKGGVFKAIMGGLVLALISNIMNLLAVPAYPQDIIKGIIIIIAVLLQVFTDRSEVTV